MKKFDYDVIGGFGFSIVDLFKETKFDEIVPSYIYEFLFYDFYFSTNDFFN
jgi:hypothetical protein